MSVKVDNDKVNELLARVDSVNDGKTPAPLSSEFVIHNDRYVDVLVSDLRTAIDANPDHPLAANFRLAIKGFPADYNKPLSVAAVDLEALLKDRTVKTVVTHEPDEDGEPGSVVPISRKKLGESRTAIAESPKSPTPVVLENDEN